MDESWCLCAVSWRSVPGGTAPHSTCWSHEVRPGSPQSLPEVAGVAWQPQPGNLSGVPAAAAVLCVNPAPHMLPVPTQYWFVQDLFVYCCCIYDLRPL